MQGKCIHAGNYTGGTVPDNVEPVVGTHKQGFPDGFKAPYLVADPCVGPEFKRPVQGICFVFGKKAGSSSDKQLLLMPDYGMNAAFESRILMIKRDRRGIIDFADPVIQGAPDIFLRILADVLNIVNLQAGMLVDYNPYLAMRVADYNSLVKCIQGDVSIPEGYSPEYARPDKKGIVIGWHALYSP